MSKAAICFTQEPSPQRREAIEELAEAARAYKAGDFVEAQKRSERALELNPANQTAPFYIARSIHAQYKPGVNTTENIEKARAAITAYRRILARDPNNEEAYKAIAFLLGDIKENEEQREWIMRRATDETLPADKRAEAYIALASKDWDCSYEITESPEIKYASQRKGQLIIRYRRPKNESDFLRAKQCATNGLENTERAISLEPDNDVAWSYKGNLLIEMAKLSEMDGLRAERVEYERQSAEAMQRNAELREEKARREP